LSHLSHICFLNTVHTHTYIYICVCVCVCVIHTVRFPPSAPQGNRRRRRRRRNRLAESKKWCLQGASCGIVIFAVSTSGYTLRSTVTIKQAALGRREHICCHPSLPPSLLPSLPPSILPSPISGVSTQIKNRVKREESKRKRTLDLQNTQVPDLLQHTRTHTHTHTHTHTPSDHGSGCSRFKLIIPLTNNSS